MLFGMTLQQLIQFVIIVLVSLTVHEFAHAFVAISLGDETPRKMGRLTLNPLAHIDPIGFILLVVVHFGWAKPVVFNPANLKNPRRDEILIAIAGPVSNLLFAFLGVFIVWAERATHVLVQEASLHTFQGFMVSFVALNVGLAVFNMIPIPPLDGSHLVTVFLRKVNASLAATYFRYGSYALLAVIVFQLVTRIEILPISRLIFAIAAALFGVLGFRLV
jgi:Zn-dependent protease